MVTVADGNGGIGGETGKFNTRDLMLSDRSC